MRIKRSGQIRRVLVLGLGRIARHDAAVRRGLLVLILISTVGVMPTSGLSPPLPGSFSPMLTGRMLFGAPLKAAIIESDSTRNFPSLTEDMAYITVNSANSKVTRSP